MGRVNGPYKPDFPEGTLVKIAGRADLEVFQKVWKLHNPLRPEQLEYAGRIVTVKAVGYYHGGDELYELVGVPGFWHEACLARDG